VILLLLCCVCDTKNTMKTAIIHARIEPQTKQKAEGVLRKLGLTPTEAIRIFYQQILLRGGLPFPVAIPKELTSSTLEKRLRGEEIEEFESVEELFKNWEK
jgi:DNA-damage-inducible protein J